MVHGFQICGMNIDQIPQESESANYEGTRGYWVRWFERLVIGG
jgi:hypothetical protein